MNDEILTKARELGCSVSENTELSALTSFRIGGKCGGVIKPRSTADCCNIVKYLGNNGIKYRVMGRGSNIIADDRGIEDIILLLSDNFSDIRYENDLIVCDAGASLASFCKYALEKELTGAEFAFGIPGSIGGAVYMNAGAYGGEIKDIIEYAEAAEKKTGIIRRFSPDEMQLSYRHSFFMNDEYIILSAAFRLKNGSKTAIKEKMDDIISRRREKQPLEYPSAGSFFKRPEGSYASLLIEQCGLKGYSSGGAQVSEKHSGFVINRGGASFDDILALAEHVKNVVKEKTGYVLEPEPIFFTDRQ